MRLGTYAAREETWPGIRTDAGVVCLPEAGAAAGVDLPATTADLLADWQWRRKAELALDYAAATGVGVYDEGDLTTLAPVPNPGKIVCVGLNYRDHAEEGGNPIPDEPVLFAKFPTTVNDPGGEIAWDPDYTEKVDYEAELVAVVGEETRRVDPDEAMDHVAGFTVGNDVSARDLQHGDGQWVRGKSLDGFAPTGPELVTTDEVSDPHDLDIWTEVNGQRLQESNTDQFIFGVDELVAFCSRAFTLEPGDLLFTGTPPGVGVYREPPVLLGEGDEVTVGIEELGELHNHCAFE
jgi:2-keto-4-pentenoate hydratase/2-oxohepta-3-ene-1,7-dioic acid hydratase in catechol pathway